MSKYLSTILGAREPQFSQLIQSLESAAAGVGVDVRLTAEIRAALKEKLSELGLDPQDTTAAELYHALILKAHQDDTLLRDAFKITEKSDSVEIIQSIATYFSKSPLIPELWALKRTALKKLLAENIPNKTMKVLHYRSMASMLKRESPATIYAVAHLVEGRTYKQKLLSSIKKLSSSDFEISKVEFVQFSTKQWEAIQKQLKRPAVPVFSLPEANALVIIPAATHHTQGLTMLVSALVLHETRRLKEHASYLKFRSLDSSLHHHVQELARKGHISMLTIQGQGIFWHHVHRVIAKRPEGRSYLEPHVNEDDLAWTALEASLAGIDERLSFWIGTHQLGFASGEHVVSLHLIDVCLNALYKKSVAVAGRRFLADTVWDELLVRYLDVPPFNQMLERHMYKMTDSAEDFLYD